jgi:CBS domain containing-hemolysin-like protein
MITALSLLFGIAVVLGITVATGYFVAQEFAYMAVDRSRLKAAAADGDAAAERALNVTRRTSFMLSGAQLGITVTGLLVGYVAEPLIGESLGEVISEVGISTAAGVVIGTLIALLFSTFVQMLFGELFPKNLAIALPQPVARRLGRSTLIYLRAFGGVIWIFDQASNLLLRALGIEPVHDIEHSATVRDLEHIVAESREAGDISPDLSLLLDRILDFPQRTAEHAMIPRSRVDVVEADQEAGEVRLLMSEGHSRYPVVDEEGRVIGLVHLADVMDAADPHTPVAELMRPASVLPTLMALPDALRQMNAERAQLVCVVDEFGGFDGVLTFEDLAEELVGEITDEHDPGRPEKVIPLGEGTWLVPGDFHVDEIERSLGHRLPEGDYETIAGLVIAAHGALPAAGSAIEIELPPDPGDLDENGEAEAHRVRAEVVSVENHVPSSIRLRLLTGAGEREEQG